MQMYKIMSLLNTKDLDDALKYIHVTYAPLNDGKSNLDNRSFD